MFLKILLKNRELLPGYQVFYRLIGGLGRNQSADLQIRTADCKRLPFPGRYRPDQWTCVGLVRTGRSERNPRNDPRTEKSRWPVQFKFADDRGTAKMSNRVGGPTGPAVQGFENNVENEIRPNRWPSAYVVRRRFAWRSSSRPTFIPRRLVPKYRCAPKTPA